MNTKLFGATGRLAAVFVGLAAASPALAATTGANGSHDPSRMLECEGKVYVYSTGGGAKSSANGLAWTNEASPPWNRSLPNNQGIWAPDGIFVNGQYLLFGSMWSDAKASAVVLLTSPTLNPRSPSYRWTDRGVVISGPSGVSHSVIDPAPVLDAQGNLYLVWGGGYPFPNEADSIFLTRLNNDTGLPIETDPGWRPPNSPGYALKQGHKEGPYIHFHDGYFYLFYQTGSCCSGASSTYLIHVARSTDIEGPYTDDRNFYGSTGSIHGPGHIGVYSACGFERFTYHYYPDSGGSVIGENELRWDANGWPSVGPESTAPLAPCGTGGGGMGGGGGATGGGGAGGDGAGGMLGSAGSGGIHAGGASFGGAAGNALGGADGGGMSSGGATANGGASGSAGAAAFGGAAGTGGRGITSGSGGAPVAPGGTAGTIGGSGGNGVEPPNAVDDAESASGCSCRLVACRGRGDGAVALLSVALALVAARRRRHSAIEPATRDT